MTDCYYYDLDASIFEGRSYLYYNALPDVWNDNIAGIGSTLNINGPWLIPLSAAVVTPWFLWTISGTIAEMLIKISALFHQYILEFIKRLFQKK